jgi:TolA-binding protein
MCKKMLLRLFFICTVSLPAVNACYADEEEEVYRAKENICSLIEKGKFAEAKSAAEKMAVEFAGQEKLPEMLYWVAGRFQTFDRFENAKQIQEQIIRDFPESPWANKARMGYAMTEAMSLIMSGKYAEAKAVTDKMDVDFAGNHDLPEALFWIAERYQRVDKFEEARQTYQQIIENYPGSPFANKAKLWLSRTDVSSLIVSGNYAGAQEALDKMVADFAKSPDLPEELFWTTERYERASRFVEAKHNYQRIMHNFPYNPYAKRAKLGISRADVMSVIASQDYQKAEESLNKFVTDFNSHSDMPWSLYSIADRHKKINRSEDVNRIYRQILQNYPDSLYASKVRAELGILPEQETQKQFSTEAEKNAIELYRLARQYEDSNDITLAKQTYERVINEYPGTIKAENSVLDIHRLEIREKLEAGDTDQAGVLIDKLVADFKTHPYLSTNIFRAAEVCYKRAYSQEKNNNTTETRQNLNAALKLLNIVINQLPTSQDVSYSLYLAGYCHYQLGDYQKSADMFQRVVDDYPGYELAWNALFMAAESYQGLKRAGAMSPDEADSKTRAAYVRLLQTYPDCSAAIAAQNWLGKHKAN